MRFPRGPAAVLLVLALSCAAVARGESPAAPAPPAPSGAGTGAAATDPDGATSERPDDLAIPSAFAAAMRDFGYRARLERTDGGKPMISSRVARSEFDVTFYGCGDDGRCTHVVVTASWDYDETADPLAALNRWNDTMAYGRAWYHEKTGAVGLDVTWTLAGRIDRATLEDQLVWWNDAVEDFSKFLDDELYENGHPETQDASARDI